MPLQDKQKRNQAKPAIGRRPIFRIGLCFLGISGGAGSALTRGQSDEPVSTMRLIAADGQTNGAYRAAIIIRMPSGSHTYWRTPGEAGVPPVLALTGSSNIAKAELLFPAPTRINEGGLQAYGYADHVVFPLEITPGTAGSPSILRVDLAYAVCNTICMPVRDTAILNLPSDTAKANESQVASAFDALPVAPPPADRDDLQVVPIPGGRQAWRLTWLGAMPLDDIFVEAPDGYAFETVPTASPNVWMLVASQMTSAETVSVTLTLAGPRQSFVIARMLDVRARNP